MKSDPGEKTNLYDENPEIVAELMGFLEKDIEQGRSTPGPKQENDAKIVMWKGKKKS